MFPSEYMQVSVIDSVGTGLNAREERIRYGLSLVDIASAMGCSATYVSMLERGRKKWSEELVEKYSIAIRKAFKERANG